MQAVARRLLICGMHVHVGVDDDDLRIDLLSQVAYFLPHLLALSTSSPFWRGDNTGLMSYRLSVFNELPRTGLPEKFDSYGEYIRHVQVLVDAGVLKDGTMIWWDIRPHTTFPTLENRVADICTHMDDGITIAAMYACILSMLIRLRRSNQRWRYYSNMLIAENRWRAQRYGFERGLVDFGRGEIVSYSELLEELLELLRPDAERLDCVTEIERARNILARGTSAHRQVAVYNDVIAAGASQKEALKSVVDWLVEETVRDL
ncbi:MAG: YbdK family carboxylate-amine ligase, partial [Pseudomonadota bacterium]